MATTRSPSSDRRVSAAPEPAMVSAALEALRAEERFGKERVQRQTAEAHARHLEAVKAADTEQIRRHEYLVEELRKALYSLKSEKLDEDDRQLSFEDLGMALEEAQAHVDESHAAAQPAERARRSRVRRSARFRSIFPAWSR